MSGADVPRVHATVVYARPDRQWVIELELEPGTTLGEAFERSGLRQACPELATGLPPMGVFHRPYPPDTPVEDGERIEIYRPLQIEPMAARLLRGRRAAASQAKAAKGK
jgi:uncharacterized protein